MDAPALTAGGSASSCSIVDPTLKAVSTRLGCALVNRAEPLGNALRCEILGPNKARGPSEGKMLEQPVASRPRGFGRKALALKGSVERIDDFRFWPIELVVSADGTDNSAAVDLFAGPHAIAA